ncbi:NUDIX domain-containing protein [Nocardia thailandica]
MESLSSRTVYRNPWMRVREDTVRRADGSTGIYGVVDKSDFALVIPFDGNGFRLVEQFRYPIGARSWEFPAGAPPAGTEATPIELAHNELREETGLRAGRMTYLGALAAAPSTINATGHCFLATELTQGAHEREPEEQDMVERWFARAEFERLLGTEIVDTHTLAAYTLLLMHERAQAG